MDALPIHCNRKMVFQHVHLRTVHKVGAAVRRWARQAMADSLYTLLGCPSCASPPWPHHSLHEAAPDHGVGKDSTVLVDHVRAAHHKGQQVDDLHDLLNSGVGHAPSPSPRPGWGGRWAQRRDCKGLSGQDSGCPSPGLLSEGGDSRRGLWPAAGRSTHQERPSSRAPSLARAIRAYDPAHEAQTGEEEGEQEGRPDGQVDQGDRVHVQVECSLLHVTRAARAIRRPGRLSMERCTRQEVPGGNAVVGVQLLSFPTLVVFQ